MKMEISIDQFETYADGLDHSEDIAFDREGILWAGGELGQIYRIPEKGRVEEVANIGGFCLGLAFSSTDELFVCNPKLGCVMRVQKSGNARLFADSVAGRKLKLPNYGVFDSSGNLYVSDSGDWSKSSGFICAIRSAGLWGGVSGRTPTSFPNGLALSADERFLFIAQSHTDDVLQVEIRNDGTAGDREVYVRGIERVPDGLAFDIAGNLYVSCYASDNIYRVAPDRTVTLLAYDRDGTTLARPTNIAFGGPGNEYLYIANLGRWHINRVRIGIKGQALVNQRI